MTFHPVLSPSPLEKAFCYVATGENGGSGGSLAFLSNSYQSDSGSNEEEHDLPPYWLSPPEVSLLRSAEENPLEYTLADNDDAVSYVRILLKMLEQVTTGSSQTPHNNNNHRNTTHPASAPGSPSRGNSNQVLDDERILTLDTPMFSEDDAFGVYYQSTRHHKRLVVAHYCVTKIYEIICVSLDSDGGIPTVSELFHGKYTDNIVGGGGGGGNIEETLQNTIHLETDEWSYLIKILYNRSLDEYTKRGAALILAFVLKAGCERNEKLARKRAITASKWKPDEDLLDLFSEEHKTPLSPSTPPSAYGTTSTAAAAAVDAIEDTLGSLISWLTARLQRSGEYASLGVVTPTMGVLMSTTQPARRAFVRSGGIGYICRHLRSKPRRRQPQQALMQQRRSSFERTSSGATNSNTRSYHPEPTPVLMSANTDDSPTTRQRRTIAGTSSSSKQKRTYVTNDSGFLGKNNSFGSTGTSSSNDMSDSAKLMMPALDLVEKNLDSMISTASGAAEAAAKMARSAPAEIAASLQAAASSASSASPLDTATTSSSLSRSSSFHSAKSSSSVQQLYDLVFCLWCLSLECPNDVALQKHFARDGAIPALAHLLKKVPREKVLRVTLACLRSLLALDGDDDTATTTAAAAAAAAGQSSSPPGFVRDMIGCGILKSLDTVRQRRWNDSDLEDDLTHLQTALAARTEDLTQWSAYEAEIATGVLRWDDMLHTHDFFRVNARKMEGRKGDFQPLRRLVEILYASTASGKLRILGRDDAVSYVGLTEQMGGWDEDDLRDDEVRESLAVCLFDIGEFARSYPNAKSVLGRIGGAKALVMHYVHHPRDDVREQALLCASKLLIRNWRAIGE